MWVVGFNGSKYAGYACVCCQLDSPWPCELREGERVFSCILFRTKAQGWDSDIMPGYVLMITSTQKHGCPTKGTPWALCTQPISAVWGHFTPVLRIVHTSGPPYFRARPIGADFSVPCQPWVGVYGCVYHVGDV